MSLAHEKEIEEYETILEQFKRRSFSNPLFFEQEIREIEAKINLLKEKVYRNLSAWDRVAISRHPQRPKSIDYIKAICNQFCELSGDRLFRDDPAIICGLAEIGEIKFMLICQEKGFDTESRLKRNFGMPHPEGYRKAMRCMRIAAKFRLPILSLIDTPGAYPGLSAEERGQGWAIANNLYEMARIPTQIIVLVIGEGCSGGALGIGVGDAIGILEHSYYSVISPEGCASILWKNREKNGEAAAALKMHPEDLLELGVVDEIIPEPLGGAHQQPIVVYENVCKFVVDQSKFLKKFSIEELLERRYQKFRAMGRFQLREKK